MNVRNNNKYMTRINVGICPSTLSSKHLLAEHREIKRIPNMVKSGRAVIKDIPETFTLGKGHVKFFYTRLGFLLTRYKQIHLECKVRGFNVTDYSEAWSNLPLELMGDYIPTIHDAKIIKQRINYGKNKK